MDQLAAILRKKEESMSNQEGMREQRERPVGSPLASLEFTRRNFDNPALEWRRLLSEVLGTFLLVLTAAGVKANLLLTHFGNLKWTHPYCTARKQAFFKVREFATTLICSAMAAQSVPSEEEGIKGAPLS